MRASIRPISRARARDQADDRHQRRGDRADDLAAEHVERRQGREILDVVLADRRAVEDAAADREDLGRLRPSRSAFATATMSPSASMNAIAVGPSSIASSASAPARLGRALRQRVLDDGELRALLDHLRAQLVDLGDRQAAVVGDEERGRRLQTLGQLLDDSFPCLLSASVLPPETT
jgi:hypothetical protein